MKSRVRAYDWGDDPYATLHMDARKAKLYDFAADYRDIAYFDFLPSYATHRWRSASCSTSNRSTRAAASRTSN